MSNIRSFAASWPARIGFTLSALFAILVLCFGVWHWRRQSQFVNNAVETSGVIVELDDSVSNGNTVYRPVFEFVDESGLTHRVRSLNASSQPMYRLDEVVQVMYAPDDPARASIKSFFELWMGVWALLGLGSVGTIVFGGFAMYGHVAHFRNSRSVHDAG